MKPRGEMSPIKEHALLVTAAYADRGAVPFIEDIDEDSGSGGTARLVVYAEGFHWRVSIDDWGDSPKSDADCLQHDDFRQGKYWFSMCMRETPERTAELLVDPSIGMIGEYIEWSRDHYSKGARLPVFRRDWLIREGRAEELLIKGGAMVRKEWSEWTGDERFRSRSHAGARYGDEECVSVMNRKFEFLVNVLERALDGAGMEKGDRARAQETIDDMWEAHSRTEMIHAENYAEIGRGMSREVWTKFKCKPASERFIETEFEWTAFSEGDPSPADPGMARVRKVGADDAGRMHCISVSNALRRDLTTSELVEALERDE